MSTVVQVIRWIIGLSESVRTASKSGAASTQEQPVIVHAAPQDSPPDSSLSLVHPAVLDRARHYLQQMPTPTAAERMPRARLLVSFIGKYGRPESVLCDAIGEHTDEVMSLVFAQDTLSLEKVFEHSPSLLRKLFWMSDDFLLALFRHEPRVLHAVFLHSHFVLERLLQHSDALLRQMAGKSDDTLYQIFRHDDRVVEKIVSPSDSVMATLLAHDDSVLQRMFGYSNDFYLSNLFSHDDHFLGELFGWPGESLNSLFGCDDYLLEKLFAYDTEQIVPFLRKLKADPAMLGDDHRIAEAIANLDQLLRSGTESTGKDISHVAGVLDRIDTADKRAALTHFHGLHALAEPSLVSRVFEDAESLVTATKAISAETLDDMLALPPDVLKAIFSLPAPAFHSLFGQSDTLLGWIFLYPPFVTRRISFAHLNWSESFSPAPRASCANCSGTMTPFWRSCLIIPM